MEGNWFVALIVLFVWGAAGACSGGLERFSSPCPGDQELREERYDATSIKAQGCVGTDSENNYRRQGHWEFFHPNGQKRQESSYRDGEMEGLITLWYENGKKEWEATYRYGTQTSRTEWDANGNQTYSFGNSNSPIR
jgi:hypothetical protein